MLHIGVTGGIGSGKSTFLRVWERHGVPVVYADDLAKELMVSDNSLRKDIATQFGSEAYHPDGSLNRAFLARAAFTQGRIDELNRLVHPVVYRELDARKKEAEKEDALLFAHESALLLHTDRSDLCDVVILLVSPQEERVRRVTERDNVPPEEVNSRIKRQPDFDKLAAKADLVIHNDSTADVLERKAGELLTALQALADTGAIRNRKE